TVSALLSAAALAFGSAGSASAAGAMNLRPSTLELAQLATGSTVDVPCTGADGGPAGLIQAIVTADQDPGTWTISLDAGCTYDFTGAYLGTDMVNGPDGEGQVGLEDWYGPSALPA